MKQSISYYVTLFIIKLKGLKNDFSKDPIDFKKIRKEDIRHPQKSLFKEYKVTIFKISKTLITEIKRSEPSNSLLLFIHGGAFISGPAKHHWDTTKEILELTNQTVWMCDYPKAPEHKIQEISENMDKVYQIALESYPANQITLIGDSVGGSLITALVQRLVLKSIPLPLKIILVSPVMDASMSNPQIKQLDKNDPMLSKVGVLSAKKMCAGNTDLKDAMISPLYGSFEKFPQTILFLATNDITYPDQKLAEKKFIDAGINLETIEGKNMPHIWPFLPVMKEAKSGLQRIIHRLNHHLKIE